MPVTAKVFAIPLVRGASPAAEGEGVLDVWVGGPENGLLGAALEQFDHAEEELPGLYLYGPVASGKTALARTLAQRWIERRYAAAAGPASRAIYLQAADFQRAYQTALETDGLEDLRRRWRQPAVFILEGVEQLRERHPVQAELLHTLDALAQTGTLAILTSTRVPWRLPQLMPGLSSRLSSCLGVPLEWPGPEARRSILERLAQLRETMLGADVVDYLADSLEGSFLELRGALIELEVAAKTAKRNIDLAFAREHVAGRQSQEGVGLATITTAVAKCFRVKSADLKGPSRQKGLVLARQIGMYLSRQLTGHSLQAIGEHFGGRDHTTVLHACSKTELLLSDDPGTRQTVQQLLRQLTGRGAE